VFLFPTGWGDFYFLREQKTPLYLVPGMSQSQYDMRMLLFIKILKQGFYLNGL